MNGEGKSRIKDKIMETRRQSEMGWGLEKKRWPCDAEEGGGVCVNGMNVCLSARVGVSNHDEKLTPLPKYE